MSESEFRYKKENTITVHGTKICSHLLQKGYRCVDILPDKRDPDHKRSVLVFELKEGIKEEIFNFKTELTEKEENERHSEVTNEVGNVVSFDDR